MRRTNDQGVLFSRQKPRVNLHSISLCIAVNVIQESERSPRFDPGLARTCPHGHFTFILFILLLLLLSIIIGQAKVRRNTKDKHFKMSRF